MTTISITIDETARQYAVDKANAVKQAEWDRAEAAKHAHDSAYTPQAFVPETLAEYVQRIETGLDASAAQLRTRDHIAVIQAQDPSSIALVAGVLSAPESPAKDALITQARAIPLA